MRLLGHGEAEWLWFGWGLARAVGRLTLAAVAAGAIGLAVPAGAAADGCAPLGGAPGFRPLQGAELRAYDTIEFTVLRGGRPETEIVSGAKCYQVYVADTDVDTNGVPALQALYRERLEKIGARIVFADRHRLHARLSEAGRETWFRIDLQDREIDVTVVRRHALTPSLTRSSGRDYRLLGHMPDYEEVSSTKHADEVRRFTVPGSGDLQTVEIRGAVHEVAYRAKSRDRLSSDAEIQENYRAALRALGADILFNDWRTTTARHVDRGRMVWLRVTSQVSEIAMLAVEAKLAPPRPRLSDRALAAALAQKGRATVASGLGVGDAPTQVDHNLVRQIVALLRHDKSLVLDVVAHTDDLGGRDTNSKRSQAQAEAIAAAVVKQGIASDRIDALGAGADQPVADNATVEGRAQNRRFELVRKLPPPPPLPRPRPAQ
jgi:OmpA family